MSLETYVTVSTYIFYWIAFWQTLFVIAYWRAPWWHTPIGRALMLKGTALALIFDIFVLSKIFGENYPGRFYVGIGVFLLIAGGSTYQALVVIETQQKARHERGSRGDPLAPRDEDNIHPTEKETQ